MVGCAPSPVEVRQRSSSRMTMSPYFVRQHAQRPARAGRAASPFRLLAAGVPVVFVLALRPPALADAPPPGPDALAGELAGDEGSTAAPGGQPPTGVIDLRDALAAALVGNPELAAFSREVRAREARALQAGLLPNPELLTEFEDFGGSGDRRTWETAQTTLSLSQLVELGGKRAKRRRAAALERDLADWDYEARRLSVLAEAVRAFVKVLEAQERLALAANLAGLAERSLATVAATVKAGAVSPVEETRARVALSRSTLERIQLERDLEAARAALAATWGAQAVTFQRAGGDLRIAAPPPGLNALLSALPRNPDLARWATEVDARTASLAVEEARRIPSVAVQLGGRHYADTQDGALVAGLVLPLPLFDRNQGGIAEAQRRLGKARLERVAAETTVRAQLVATYQALDAAFRRSETLERTTIPEAERLYSGAEDAYSKGLYRYLEVLDAQRTLFELRGERLEALAAYHTAAADLERLTGGSFGKLSLGEKP
jgi:cobalt-zinc-cadmium efflux system outer membrane protein